MSDERRDPPASPPSGTPGDGRLEVQADAEALERLEADADLGPADAALLAGLGRVLSAVDPEPALLRELGRAALSVRRVDEELAELVSDSVLLAGLVRSAVTDAPRLLTFAAGDLVIDLQVSAAPGGAEVIGIVDGLDPDADARVEVETGRAEVTTVPLDDTGRFELPALPPGLVRLRVRSGSVDVTTAWVRLNTGFRHPTP